MAEFGSPFSGLANDRKLSDEERVHAGEFLRLLRELAPDEEKLYAKGAKEVEEKIKKMT
jgi:rubrerythrin